MNLRLQNLLTTAESRLSLSDQDQLAGLVEHYLDIHAAPLDFSEEELASLRRLDGEPFAPAHMADVTELFARRG